MYGVDKMKLSDVGEVKVIEAILDLIRNVYPDKPLPAYDDAVAIRVSDSWVIVKIDGTSSKSSKYPWMSWSDFSYRVALGTISDIISKGGKPLGLSVSIGVPKDFTITEVLEIIKGVKELIIKVDAKFLGGDINTSNVKDYVWMDVSGIGIAKKPIPNIFRNGDLVRISNCLGFSSIEALIYYKNIDLSKAEKFLRLPYKPEPPLNFLEVCDQVTAATDISDGLYSLTKVLRRLRLDLVLSDDLPLCKEVIEFMNEFNVDTLDILKYLGEEYIIVFNDPHNSLRHYPILGELREGKGNIIYKGKVVRGGWDNFKGFIG